MPHPTDVPPSRSGCGQTMFYRGVAEAWPGREEIDVSTIEPNDLVDPIETPYVSFEKARSKFGVDSIQGCLCGHVSSHRWKAQPRVLFVT